MNRYSERKNDPEVRALDWDLQNLGSITWSATARLCDLGQVIYSLCFSTSLLNRDVVRLNTSNIVRHSDTMIDSLIISTLPLNRAKAQKRLSIAVSLTSTET